MFALDDKFVYVSVCWTATESAGRLSPALTVELRKQNSQQTPLGLHCRGVSYADKDRGCKIQRIHLINCVCECMCVCVFVERENFAVVFNCHRLRISCHKGADQLSNDSTKEDSKSIADRGFNTDMSSLVKGCRRPLSSTRDIVEHFKGPFFISF